MKIIHDDNDYNMALARIDEILDSNPEKSTELGDELDVLIVLVQKYEEEKYPIDYPDPIEALKFRMEQQQLTNNDLAEYIGSKSKVSEVLNYKRKLSLSMIKKIHKGLGIPAEVLISDSINKLPTAIPELDWDQFPLNEIIRHGWVIFEGSFQKAKDYSEELIREFLSQSSKHIQSPIFLRNGIRSNSVFDEYSMLSWYVGSLIEEKKIKSVCDFDNSMINEEFFKDLRMLSTFEEGPLLAKEYLHKRGIKLIILENLKKTFIDGATYLNSNNVPVIVLTLRYDRVDYFWFTLFHELAHVSLHLNKSEDHFFDDFSANNQINLIEKEADKLAEKELICQNEWKKFYSDYMTEKMILEFAEKCKVSPAIIAGRVQKESKNYSKFRSLLGQNKVKKLFS